MKGEAARLRTEIPAALLACPPAPTPPLAGAGQRATALYLLDLEAAHQECRHKLTLVGGLIAAARDVAP